MLVGCKYGEICLLVDRVRGHRQIVLNSLKEILPGTSKLAGVAQVADDLAAKVMADYHQRLAAGNDSASALAFATASGPNVPFVCFGSSWHAYPGGVPSSGR